MVCGLLSRTVPGRDAAWEGRAESWWVVGLVGHGVS